MKLTAISITVRAVNFMINDEKGGGRVGARRAARQKLGGAVDRRASILGDRKAMTRPSPASLRKKGHPPPART
jgi:hypothetical protein